MPVGSSHTPATRISPGLARVGRTSVAAAAVYGEYCSDFMHAGIQYQVIGVYASQSGRTYRTVKLSDPRGRHGDEGRKEEKMYERARACPRTAVRARDGDE